MKLSWSQVIFSLNLVWRFCHGNICGDVNFTPKITCNNKRSTSSSLRSFSDSDRTECATKCYYEKQCIVFFFNENTEVCSIYSSPVSVLSLTTETGSSCYQAFNYVEHWVKQVTYASFNEQYYEPYNLVGPYDTNGHWHSSPTSTAVLEFEIKEEIFVIGMVFYLLELPGTIIGIELKTSSGLWHSVYSSSQIGYDTGYSNLSLPLSDTNFKTKRIRIITSNQYFGFFAIKTFGKSI